MQEKIENRFNTVQTSTSSQGPSEGVNKFNVKQEKNESPCPSNL